MTIPLRDLRPADTAPHACRNCWCSKFEVVIVRRVALWRCWRCHWRPDEAAALGASLRGGS